MPDQPLTMHEHLKNARDKRDPEKLKQHAALMREKRRPPRECTCGRTDGTHPTRCPVGRREYDAKRKRRQQETKEQ